jgi:hemoglobin-like flavoprotein
MTSQEVSLIQSSFTRIAPIADQAAAIFYARLFELDPSIRGMFHGDMPAQGKKLMHALGACVAGLDRLETILPAIRAMGARHAGYQVRDEHYETVGEALLWTLGKGLGPDFTAEMQAAWAKVYWLLAESMKAAARDAKARTGRAVA